MRNYFFLLLLIPFSLQSCGEKKLLEIVPTLKSEVHVLDKSIDFTHLQFLDSRLGFATATTGEIFKTSDGGQSWSQAGESLGSITKIHFLDEQVGFALVENQLFRCTDGGQNWQLLRNYVNAFFVESGVVYTVQDRIWENTKSLFRSEDHGDSFIEADILFLDPYDYIFRKTLQTDNRDGRFVLLYQMGSNHRFFTFSEEFSEMQASYLPWGGLREHPVNDVRFLSESSPYNLLGVGNEGRLYTKKDEEEKWGIEFLPYKWDIHGLDEKEGMIILVGENAVWINVELEDETGWTLMRDSRGNSFTYHFNKVCFISPDEAVAVADEGVIVKFDLSYLR